MFCGLIRPADGIVIDHEAECGLLACSLCPVAEVGSYQFIPHLGEDSDLVTFRPFHCDCSTVVSIGRACSRCLRIAIGWLHLSGEADGILRSRLRGSLCNVVFRTGCRKQDSQHCNI